MTAPALRLLGKLLPPCACISHAPSREEVREQLMTSWHMPWPEDGQ